MNQTTIEEPARQLPVPVEEEVEVIAVLEAGKRSLIEGREVRLAEVRH